MNEKSSKNDLQSRVTEAKDLFEQVKDALKAPKLELENLLSKLNSVNEKIVLREKENSQLDQKKKLTTKTEKSN